MSQEVVRDNVKIYQFLGVHNFFSQALDNYFTLPKRTFPKGKYMLRVYAYWPVPSERKTSLVIGLYTPATVGLKKV